VWAESFYAERREAAAAAAALFCWATWRKQHLGSGESLEARRGVRDAGVRLAELAKDADPEMRRTALFTLRDHRLLQR